jgi:hypothetical protein
MQIGLSLIKKLTPFLVCFKWVKTFLLLLFLFSGAEPFWLPEIGLLEISNCFSYKRPKHKIAKSTHGARFFFLAGGLYQFFWFYARQNFCEHRSFWFRAKVTEQFPETTSPIETKRIEASFCNPFEILINWWFASVMEVLGHSFWAAIVLMQCVSLWKCSDEKWIPKLRFGNITRDGKLRNQRLAS